MQNGWPSGTEKKSTAYSALSWACTLAKSKEWPKLELNQDNVCMIINYSLNYRSQLKTFIIEHIGYWGVIPSEEECKNQNMTPDDVTTYTCQHVEALWPDDFLHNGKDGNMQPPWFNHHAFHHVVIEWCYCPNGAACLFPFNFGPLFPLPAITLITLLVEVVFWEHLTSQYIVKSLSNDDCNDYKAKMSSISLMAADTYQKHFLNLI